MNATEITIMPEPTYRIRRAWRNANGRKCYNYFIGTRVQCVRRIAWWYVWDKYGERSYAEHIGVLDCECSSYNPEGDDYANGLPSGCPIHDRQDGYLVRLSRRMARVIDANWDAWAVTP
jgi:hypothetical protein